MITQVEGRGGAKGSTGRLRKFGANFRHRLHNQQKCVASESYHVSKRNLIGPNLPVGKNLVARALGDPIRWRYDVFLLNVKPVF